MSFSSGVFTLVAGNPVVTGTTVSSTWANNTLNDIATGLSTCILKDGTQTTTATIPFANPIAYGGVTLSNAVTGTGNMVLSASPTLTGTAGFTNITASGTLAVTGAATAASMALGGTSTINNYAYGVWTPTLNSFTIVNGSGAISVTGEYWKLDLGVWVQCTITGTGTANIASVANTSNITGINTVAGVVKEGTVSIQDSTGSLVIGGGLIQSDNAIWTPAWAAKTPATTGRIVISGFYRA